MDPQHQPTELQQQTGASNLEPFAPSYPPAQYMPEKKKRSVLKIILIICGVIIAIITILILIAILVVRTTTSSALNMSDSFVNNLQAKSINEAYQQTSSEFQSVISKENFASELDNLNQYISGEEKLIDKDVIGEVGTGTFAVFIYQVQRASGGTHYLKVELKNTDGFWQIINFSTSEIKPTIELSSSVDTYRTAERRIENNCFSLSLPSSAPANLQLTDTSNSEFCSFIVQFENLGDAPVIVGEVFSGDDTSAEKANLVPDQLSQGIELDLIDLGLLRTGQGNPLELLESQDFSADGQKGIYYTHASNRSVSGQAHSAMIETPQSVQLAGKPTSALLAWGVANQANKDLMLEILQTIEWK